MTAPEIRTAATAALLAHYDAWQQKRRAIAEFQQALLAVGQRPPVEGLALLDTSFEAEIQPLVEVFASASQGN